MTNKIRVVDVSLEELRVIMECLEDCQEELKQVDYEFDDYCDTGVQEKLSRSLQLVRELRGELY